MQATIDHLSITVWGSKRATCSEPFNPQRPAKRQAGPLPRLCTKAPNPGDSGAAALASGLQRLSRLAQLRLELALNKLGPGPQGLRVAERCEGPQIRPVPEPWPGSPELGPHPCWASTQPFNYGGVLGRRISVPPKSVMPALVSRRNSKQIPAVGFQGKGQPRT